MKTNLVLYHYFFYETFQLLPYSKMFEKYFSISDAQKQEGNAFSPIFCAD